VIERQRQGTIDVLRCTEAIVAEHLEELAVLVSECFAGRQPSAVLDLHMVPLIDSAGLEWLLDTGERFDRCGGVLKLAQPNELCREILACSGVGERFEVLPDVKAAVGSFVQ